MKKPWLVVVGLGVSLALASMVAAAAGQADGKGRRPGNRPEVGRPFQPGAGEGQRMQGPGPGGMAPDFSRIPNLTEAQKQEIGEIRKAAMERIRQIHEQMRDDVKKVLTPEQVEALEKLVRPGDGQGRPGMGPGRPGMGPRKPGMGGGPGRGPGADGPATE